MALSRGDGAVAMVWLANAPVVALLLLRPGHARYTLPVVGLANALVNAWAGNAAAEATAFAVANLVSIGLGLALLRHFGLTASALRSPVGLCRLLLFGGALPEVAGATVATAALVSLGGGGGAAMWSAWVQGAWIGSLVMLPLVLQLAAVRPAVALGELGQGSALSLLLLCVGSTLLSLAHLPFPFVVMAMPLLWAAVTVGPLVHAVLVAAVACTVAAAAYAGVFVPPPIQSHWETMHVSLALMAALWSTQMLAAATAQQREQMALLVAQTEALRRANDGLEQFVRVASHDLREPLNTVAQFTRLLREEAGAALAPGPSRYLDLVAQAAARMRRLLDDLLQYARLQREDLGEPTAVDLTPLLEEVREVLAGTLRTSDAALAIEPLPVVRGHAPLLQLMFQNLVGNAVKFVAPGVRPAVHVSAQVVGSRAHVTVADNGIGIADEERPRLFKPFSRLHLRRQYEGTGLGLSLVVQVARLHGGQVQLESAPGRGSRFTVDLPLGG